MLSGGRKGVVACLNLIGPKARWAQAIMRLPPRPASGRFGGKQGSSCPQLCIATFSPLKGTFSFSFLPQEMRPLHSQPCSANTTTDRPPVVQSNRAAQRLTCFSTLRKLCSESRKWLGTYGLFQGRSVCCFLGTSSPMLRRS